MPSTTSTDATHITINNRAGWFSWLGWMLFLLCIPVILVGWALYRDYFDIRLGTREQFHSLNASATDKVAVIHAVGVLAEAEGFIKQQINKVRADDQIKAVVLRINSPGGTVTASDFLYHHLNKLREERKIPIVVSMGGICASGGYYISMAVGEQPDTIYAEPTTTTGSIGVIIPHYDLSGFLEKYDIKNDSIVSHPRKQMLSMTREITPEHRQILQDYVDNSFERFKKIVKSGRPAFNDDPAALDKLATGEVFTADQALDSGLVDKIGFIDDAVLQAVTLAASTRTRRVPSPIRAHSTP